MDTEVLIPLRETRHREPALVEPVIRRLPENLNPLRALGAVESAAHTVYFESGGEEGDHARWTILAFDPLYRLEVRAGTLWRTEGGSTTAVPGEPLRALAQAWPERLAMPDEAPVPFMSGFAGYLAYDLKDQIERYPQRAKRESVCADLSLGFYDVVWAWDRKTGRGWAVSSGLPEPDPRRREERARARLAEQWARIVDGGSPPRESSAPAGPPVSNFTRDEYLRAVERALERIAAGDIYQVNLSQRLLVERAPDPAVLFRRLRRESPAPFSAFLSYPGGGIASSSPERFFRVQGDRIETWPIKGTRPRGATPEEDAALKEALRSSAKDRAENVMIVDLERNDLGRICDIGTVAVPALWDVASYANVHHLVSRVEGRLRSDVHPVDVIRALSPGGSITGAPKIRAVEIIDELEPTRRGIYTGALGYWDVRGGCDWNIAIRTIVVESGTASFHVGGGIVADSTPEGEYEETLVKASAMLRALSGPST